MVPLSFRNSGTAATVIDENDGVVIYILGGTSTDDWLYRRTRDHLADVMSTVTAIQDIGKAMDLWGWWTAFYPPTPYRWTSSTPPHFACRRPQARACHLDRRRWKRRRFIHSLRGAA
jgi:hypothetical protein